MSCSLRERDRNYHPFFNDSQIRSPSAGKGGKERDLPYKN